MNPAPRQAPQEKTVDCAARESRPARGAGLRHVVKDPRDLGGGEIGVEEEARSLADQILNAFGLEARTFVGGSPVLPDDRAVDGLAGRALPEDNCLALVGDPDSRYALQLDTAGESASRATASVSDQIASGSCSTAPSAG